MLLDPEELDQIKSAHNSEVTLISHLSDQELLSRIVENKNCITQTELHLKKYKAAYAADLNVLEERNAKRRKAQLAEYEIPVSAKESKVKTAKVNGDKPKTEKTAKQVSVPVKDRPIINLYLKLKNVDKTLAMLASVGYKEEEVKRVISEYQKSQS